MTLKIKEAVQIAIDNVVELFSEQKLSSVLLEEVARDSEGNFLITVGFERAAPKRAGNALAGGIGALLSTQRAYKVAFIDKETGELISVKDRLLER